MATIFNLTISNDLDLYAFTRHGFQTKHHPQRSDMTWERHLYAELLNSIWLVISISHINENIQGHMCGKAHHRNCTLLHAASDFFE